MSKMFHHILLLHLYKLYQYNHQQLKLLFVYLYLLISILLAIPPATRELKFAVAGIVVISIIIWLVTWAGIRLSGRAGRVQDTLWLIFSFALALLVYVTAVTFAAIAVGRLFQAITSERNKPDEQRP